MRKVIYTGNFSSNWGYFKGVQNWHILSMHAQNKYAKSIGAEYRVIDNSNDTMRKIYDLYRGISNGEADGWTLGTLVTYAALAEFSYGPHDSMVWLDMDIYIRKHYIDMFDYIVQDKLYIDHYDPELNTTQTIHKKFFVNSRGLDYTRNARAGTFMVNRAVVYDYFNRLKELDINILHPSFAKKVCDEYKEFSKTDEAKKSPVMFMCDECLIDALISHGLQYEDTPKDLKCPVIYGDDYDRKADVFGFHFAGKFKYHIESNLS